MVLLIEKQKNLLRAYLKRFPKQRRDDVGYRQISAKGDAWESAPFEKGVAPENGWLTVADLDLRERRTMAQLFSQA